MILQPDVLGVTMLEMDVGAHPRMNAALRRALGPHQFGHEPVEGDVSVADARVGILERGVERRRIASVAHADDTAIVVAIVGGRRRLRATRTIRERARRGWHSGWR